MNAFQWLTKNQDEPSVDEMGLEAAHPQNTWKASTNFIV
jgi:hypothetical protein